MRPGFTGSVLAVAATLGFAFTGPARAQEPFFKGKTVRIIVGGAAGAAYDFVGRAIAAHIGSHIPGEPNVVVENMPGAASIVMTNYLYNRAPRDGTAIGMPLNGIVLEPRLQSLSRNGSNVQFDLSKMSFIGTTAQQPQVLWVWHATPFKNVDDLRQKESTFGATAPGGDNYILPNLSNRLLGTKMKVVTGYKGVNDIFLAVEQGEVQGNTANLSSLLGKPDWMAGNKARILMQFGAERIPSLKDVPTAIELAKTEEARKMFRVYATKFQTTYPLLLPPDVPADRVKILRDAFDETMKDPAFVADAKKIGIDVDPLGGEGIAKVMAEIDAVPQDVIDRLKKLLK